MKNLTDNAKKLLSYLEETGGAWEEECIEALYPAPLYPSKDIDNNERENLQRIFWKHDANCNGYSQYRPVGNSSILFVPNDNYSAKISAAYQELRKAGLASEKNSGYNDYFFYPIKP